MKNFFKVQYILVLLLCGSVWWLSAAANIQTGGYIIEHEADIAKTEPGSHNGGGTTTAFPFFSKDKTFKTAFRKRILHPGSSIGYHLQKEDEVYYIIGGKGILTMNGKDIPVSAGDAILTKPGSSHGLKPADNTDLTVLIVYDNQPAQK